MTSEPADRGGGRLVPLRAVDAQTEVRLDEDNTEAPSYVDLTSGGPQRRPIIPEHWRTWDNARRHIALAAARHGHRAAYHSVRSPTYFVKALGFAIWGVIVTARRLITWWHIPGTTRLEWQAAADGLLNDHLRLHRQGRETRRARGTILALCLAALTAAAAAMAAYASPWAWALLAAGLFVAFALAGRPAGKTISTRAELPAQVQPPTQDVIIRASGRSASPRSTRRSRTWPSRRCPPRSARTGPAGAPRSTCPTASPPAWSSTAVSSSPPGCAAPSARCGPSLPATSTPGGSSCG
jgi:S-DNA-T family DNA segregation ATPase FtsK/SpoIIIE